MSKRISPINVMIAGAQKAGTSSLGKYLDQHPDILTHSQLEMAYFVNDDEYFMGFESIYPKYFQPSSRSKVLLAKNVGIMYFPFAMERLYEHNPNCRIIIILREPVSRAYSAYWYMRRVGLENASSFSEALELEAKRKRSVSVQSRHCLYRERGIYHRQIKTLHNLFGESNIHVLLLDDLVLQPKNSIEKILQFIDVPLVDLNTSSKSNIAKSARFEFLARMLQKNFALKDAIKRIVPSKHLTSARNFVMSLNEKNADIPQIESDVRYDLASFFEPHNQELERLLGRSLDIWRIT